MQSIKITKLYIQSLIISSILNSLILVLICNLLKFDQKSAICVYMYGIGEIDFEIKNKKHNVIPIKKNRNTFLALLVFSSLLSTC